jgi:RHS repeat-associated protein
METKNSKTCFAGTDCKTREAELQSSSAAYSDVGGRKALDISLADSTVKFDYYSSSVGMNLLAERKINKIELTGKSSRLNRRTVEVYASSDGTDGTWKKVPDITFVPDREGTTLLFAEPVDAQYLKVHSTYDERDKAYKPIDNSTVSGTPAQLVEVYYSADGEDISWTFDARGNRLTETKYEGGASTGNITLEYYANSDLIKTRGTWQFNYDKNGNMLSRGTDGTWNGISYDWAADKGELWEYGYDLSNRLISVKKSAAGTDGLKAIASYAYDIRGLRVESAKDSGVTYYQYGLKGELLWSDDGSTQEKYVYANSTIWAEVRTTSVKDATYYHHTDHLGTTETITDAAGTVVWDASYEAYGKLVHENGTVSFKASFTGKQVDADTGLYYFNARWYDAELGRFVTEDPARDGSNWYEYCGNRPLTQTDPDGKAPIICDDTSGRPVAAIPGRDVKSETSIQVVRNIDPERYQQKEHPDFYQDTTAIKIRDQKIYEMDSQASASAKGPYAYGVKVENLKEGVHSGTLESKSGNGFYNDIIRIDGSEILMHPNQKTAIAGSKEWHTPCSAGCDVSHVNDFNGMVSQLKGLGFEYKKRSSGVADLDTVKVEYIKKY